MYKAMACCTILGTAFLVGADNPGGAAGKKELEKFTGSWKAVAAVRDGKEMTRARAGKIHPVVEGEKDTFQDATGKPVKGTHKLDPSKTPKEIDAVRATGKGK